jgi:hypothetical protein
VHRSTHPAAASPRRTIRRAMATLLAGGLLLVACGDDDDTATTGTPGTTAAPATDASATTTTTVPAGTVEVTLMDYKFEGLPETVAVGTKLTVVNESERELHELVAFKLPESETRSAAEIAKLPMGELMPMFAGPPAAVLLALPGGEQIAAVGDGTLTEAGRYLVFCSIPTGADPQAYLEAAGTSDGPPQVDGGPPHLMAGMYADLTVK